MFFFLTEHPRAAARLPGMWLACALIILLTVGFVLPCMLDITMTPDSQFATFSKGTWLLIAGAFWIFGAAAWLVAGRPARLGVRYKTGYPPPDGFTASQALLRHPATRSAAGLDGPVAFRAIEQPLGPDDDPDFLMELDRRIREQREDSLPDRPLRG